MKAVTGYMSEDGRFFATAENARLHEAVQKLAALCESHKPKPVRPENLLTLLANWAPQVREFIDANEAAKKRQDTEDSRAPVGDQADDADGDALDEAVEQQPIGGPEYMLEMGQRPSPKSLLQRSAVDGPRSRGDDA